MSTLQASEQALRDGDPALALKLLQDEVRNKPADAKLRIFIFQLLAVMGRWERALSQLDVASTLDVSALAMAQMYREAIRCEMLRQQVFEGRKSPMIFGMPEPWLALLIESLLVAGRGRLDESAKLRDQAFEQAEPTSGTLDDQRFQWIADADPRLGPVLEAIINGKYYWLPFTQLSEVVIEAPADLRDMVWMPVNFLFRNGGESVGLIPTRYSGSESSDDAAVVLARKTTWNEVTPDVHHGLGQRLIATDAGETPLMDVRRIVLDAAD